MVTGTLTKEPKSLNEIVTEKLKNLYNDNDQFLQEFANIIVFYNNKFEEKVKEKKEEWNNSLFKVIESQFYNGYYIAREFLEHEETVVPDEWFQQTDNLIKEQIPQLLFDTGGEDFINIIRTEESIAFIRWAITRFEDVRDMINHIILDITFLGSVRAFLDEKQERGITTFAINEEESSEGLLSPYNDIHFIDPQKYIVATAITDSSEVWELRYWSSYQLANPKIGEITIHKVSDKNQRVMTKVLPLYSENGLDLKGDLYVVTGNISNEVMDGEINNVIDKIREIVTSLQNTDNVTTSFNVYQ